MARLSVTALAFLVAVLWLATLWVAHFRFGTELEGAQLDLTGARSSSSAPSMPFSPPSATKSSSVEVKTGSLLYMTASYTMSQYLHLWNSLTTLVDICEGGWYVEIHVQVSNGLHESRAHLQNLRSALHCTRLGAAIPLVVTSFDQIGFGLTTKHRAVTMEQLDRFDYFAYAEEDMIFTLGHLNAFLAAQAQLRALFPRDPLRYTVGFLRYEDNLAVQDRLTWEYLPAKSHVVTARNGSREPRDLFLVTNNLNQAINVFPRDQLRDMQARCEFLTQPGLNPFYRELRKALNKEWKFLSVGVSEWSSSFQHVLQCGVRRLIPLVTYERFFIKHDAAKAHRRRPKSELLNMTSWRAVVQSLVAGRESFQTVEDVYNGEIYFQYNLHLMNMSRVAGQVRYQWEL